MRTSRAPLDPEQPTELDYARPAPVTRKHYRLLLFLTLLNTALLISGFLCAPLIQRTTGQFWQDFQRKREQARAQKQFLAEYQRCLSYTPATTQPVYEEDPDRAAKLYAQGGYLRIQDGGYAYIAPRPWHPPVVFRMPAPSWMPLWSGLNHFIFFHGIKNPAGQERLVCVAIAEQQNMTLYYGRSRDDSPRWADVKNTRSLQIGIYEPGAGRPRDVVPLIHVAIEDPAKHEPKIKWTRGKTWESGNVEYQLDGTLRLLPGVIDPADASHFSIPYELDGQPGRIDAYLQRDDTLLFRPTGGRVTFRSPSGSSVTWEPYGIQE